MIKLVLVAVLSVSGAPGLVVPPLASLTADQQAFVRAQCVVAFAWADAPTGLSPVAVNAWCPAVSA